MVHGLQSRPNQSKPYVCIITSPSQSPLPVALVQYTHVYVYVYTYVWVSLPSLQLFAGLPLFTNQTLDILEREKILEFVAE